AQLRRQLPSNIFVQFLAGPPEVREGIVGFLLQSVAWISLVAGPIALLVLFQLQFLPYHSASITWWQRIAILLDSFCCGCCGRRSYAMRRVSLPGATSGESR